MKSDFNTPQLETMVDVDVGDLHTFGTMKDGGLTQPIKWLQDQRWQCEQKMAIAWRPFAQGSLR